MEIKLATLCYVRSGNKTLMLHRNKRENDMHEGKWNGLGGKFNPGESPEECAIREVREESGLIISCPALRGFLTFPEFSKENDWYVFVFTASQYQGTLIESAEGELAWINDEDLLSLNLWAGDHFFLPLLEGGRIFSGKFIYKEGNLISHELYLYPSASMV